MKIAIVSVPNAGHINILMTLSDELNKHASNLY